MFFIWKCSAAFWAFGTFSCVIVIVKHQIVIFSVPSFASLCLCDTTIANERPLEYCCFDFSVRECACVLVIWCERKTLKMKRMKRKKRYIFHTAKRNEQSTSKTSRFEWFWIFSASLWNSSGSASFSLCLEFSLFFGWFWTFVEGKKTNYIPWLGVVYSIYFCISFSFTVI